MFDPELIKKITANQTFKHPKQIKNSNLPPVFREKNKEKIKSVHNDF